MIIKRIGERAYEPVWHYQKTLQRKLIDREIEESLIVCEHFPVITVGTSGKEENILISEHKLKSLGIEVFKVERGGDVTCHTPGQVVLYPILNLNFHKKDVGWYMRSLEEVVIRVLDGYGVHGERISGKTGVWVKGKKIASIGVRISRWCTMHGLSLNVINCNDVFKLINPCGYKDVRVTEMQELLKINLDKNEVTNNLIKSFNGVFNFTDVKEEDFFEKEFS